HPHNGQNVIPLASVLTNTSICCYSHGHSGTFHAKKGLSGIVNPNVWDLNSNAIVDDADLLYVEAYATQLKVYVISLLTNPTTLPAAQTIALPHPLSAETVQAPVADFSAAPVSGAAPLAVAFSDLSTNAPTAWSWNFGDGGTSSSRNPTHGYAAAGVYD